MKRSEEGVRRALERLGFQVYRSGSWTDEKGLGLLIYELDRVELPRYMLHKGPPVYLESSGDFVRSWKGRGIGPWIEGDRLYVLKRRGEVDAAKLLRSEVKSGNVAISKGLLKEIESGKISSNLNYLIEIGKKRREVLSFLKSFLKAAPPFLEQ